MKFMLKTGHQRDLTYFYYTGIILQVNLSCMILPFQMSWNLARLTDQLLKSSLRYVGDIWNPTF